MHNTRPTPSAGIGDGDLRRRLAAKGRARTDDELKRVRLFIDDREVAPIGAEMPFTEAPEEPRAIDLATLGVLDA